MNSSALEGEYRGRINRVMDYVETHLDQAFTLDELAGVACFSKYHFHRLFAALAGETLFQFIGRVRLEKATALLANNPRSPVTEIALACGFSTPAVFSRTFREAYGLSPSRYRTACRSATAGQADSNHGILESNEGKARKGGGGYTEVITIPRRTEMAESVASQEVRIETWPQATVAYVRHVGPYQGDSALFEGLWGRLMAWAGPRGLVCPEAKMLIVYHDSPEITEPDRLRLSVCITVPEDTPVAGEIGKMTIPEGRYAFARFRLSADQYGGAWQWVYGEWLPKSGYEPDDRPTFELYPEAGPRPDGSMVVEIAVPIKPA